MSTTDEPGKPTGRAEIASDEAGVPVIKLVGEIDLSNVDSVRATIEPTVSSAPTASSSTSAVSTSWTAAESRSCSFAAAKSGSVQLRNPSEIVRRIVEVTGLAAVLPMDS